MTNPVDPHGLFEAAYSEVSGGRRAVEPKRKRSAKADVPVTALLTEIVRMVTPDFPNYATVTIELPAGHWRRIRSVIDMGGDND